MLHLCLAFKDQQERYVQYEVRLMEIAANSPLFTKASDIMPAWVHSTCGAKPLRSTQFKSGASALVSEERGMRSQAFRSFLNVSITLFSFLLFPFTIPSLRSSIRPSFIATFRPSVRPSVLPSFLPPFFPPVVHLLQ